MVKFRKGQSTLRLISGMRGVKTNCTVEIVFITKGLPKHFGISLFQFLLLRQVSLPLPTMV